MTKEAKIFLARDRIQKSFAKRLKGQKASSRIVLKKDDLVLLYVPKQSDALNKVTRKFFHVYYGPYIITRDLEDNSFELANVDDHDQILGIYNRCNLKKYYSPSDMV